MERRIKRKEALTMASSLPYLWRKNTAALILDSEGNLLLCKGNARSAYWHCPQGGVETDETCEAAVQREVWEEVGLPKTTYTIVTHYGGFRYSYPSDNQKSSQWLGQEQTYFLLVCHKPKPKTNLSRSREFGIARWLPLSQIKPGMFAPFKRDVLTRVFESFFAPCFNQSRQKKNIKASVRSSIFNHIEQNLTMNRYLVVPGKKLKLRDYSPDDKSLFAGGKEESLTAFEELKSEFQVLQKKLLAESKHRILIVIQGMDASGKDGCVRNVFSGLDPQGVRVVAFKRPTPDELAHDFLWRIHREVPGNGQITIFNRSHYEDVVAVRVRKLFPDSVWKKRVRHIADFETMLAEEGTVVIKLFLNISKEEQKRRLISRLEEPEKVWKLEASDFTDRVLWDTYQTSYQDVIEKTSSESAPWYIIPGDRKWYRNLVVMRLMVEKLRALAPQFPAPKINPAEITLDD